MPNRLQEMSDQKSYEVSHEMSHEMSHELFDTVQMMQWIKEMSDFGPRRAGSVAGHQNEDYLLSLLESFGLESVQKEPIPITYKETQHSSLFIDEGQGYQPVNSQWIPYSSYTPTEGVESTLVYADPGKLFQTGSWKGKVVLTDISFPTLDIQLISKFSLGVNDPDGSMLDIKHPATWVRINWHFYRQAVKKGAIGFIGIIKDQPGGSYQMYAPYGFKEKDFLDKPIPGFWVSREDGPRLRELAKKGNTKVKITHTGIQKEGVTHNIMGRIPGKSDELIILHCHHDAPFESPVEDASGCAVVLALARYFAEKKNNHRTILVLFTAGHFYGSIGTRTFIEKHKKDIVPKVALEISVEHIAKEAIENEAGDLVFSGKAEGTGIFVPFNQAMVDTVLHSVQKHNVDRVFLLPPEGPLGDYPPTDGGDWYEAGVPLVNIISNPVYLLNAEDSLEWVMEERLSKMAAAVADIVVASDQMKKEEIARVEFKRFKSKMKLVKKLVRLKTTKFGTRPVY